MRECLAGLEMILSCISNILEIGCKIYPLLGNWTSVEIIVVMLFIGFIGYGIISFLKKICNYNCCCITFGQCEFEEVIERRMIIREEKRLNRKIIKEEIIIMTNFNYYK